jgi:hypothetical protein
VAYGRTRSAARSFLVGTVAVVCVANVAVPASGREGAPVAGMLIERIVTAIVAVHGNGQPPSVSEVNGFERRVDTAGRTISEGSFDVAPSADLEPVGGFGCSAQGDALGFRDHSEPVEPVRLEVDVGGSAARSVFHISTLVGGRRVSGRPTTQVLICAAGGARAAEQQRLLQAGIGAAYDDPDKSHILGKRWLDGPTPAKGEDSYGFAGAGDTGASGNIEQDPSGELEGSFIGPFPSGFDDYFVNGMAGWWEQSVSRRHRLRPRRWQHALPRIVGRGSVGVLRRPARRLSVPGGVVRRHRLRRPARLPLVTPSARSGGASEVPHSGTRNATQPAVWGTPGGAIPTGCGVPRQCAGPEKERSLFVSRGLFRGLVGALRTAPRVWA